MIGSFLVNQWLFRERSIFLNLFIGKTNLGYLVKVKPSKTTKKELIKRQRERNKVKVALALLPSLLLLVVSLVQKQWLVADAMKLVF